MKKLIYILMPTLIITTGSILFHSCSADDEDYDAYDLSIGNNVTRVKLNAEFPFQSGNDSAIDNPKNYKNIDPNEMNENECSLWALTKASGQQWSFTNNATNYYKNMRDYAVNNCEYTAGDSMTISTMFEIAKHYDIATGMDELSSGNAANYFSNASSNGKTIKTIAIQGHTGVFVKYNEKKQTVTYKDYEGEHTIPANQVISVLYK